MADRQRIEEASRKKGRKISPEIIEQLLGFAGPGAIKRIAGVPGLSVFLSKSTPSKGRFPASKDLKEALKNIDEQFDRINRPANISRPNTIAGKELRKNIGGKRPPDTELEALALRKQQAQRIARTKGLREVGSRKSSLEDLVELKFTKRGRLTKKSSGAITKTINPVFKRFPKALRHRVMKLNLDATDTGDFGRAPVVVKSTSSSDTITIRGLGGKDITKVFDKNSTGEAIRWLTRQLDKLES